MMVGLEAEIGGGDTEEYRIYFQITSCALYGMASLLLVGFALYSHMRVTRLCTLKFRESCIISVYILLIITTFGTVLF